MRDQAERIEGEWFGQLREARVISVGGAHRVTAEREGVTVQAIVAVDGYQPRVGDRVLLARGEGERSYVIGVLSALREPRADGPALRTQDGATAERVGRDEQEALVVRDAAGVLVFEYRPSEGKSIVHSPGPNLELRAEGHIDLVARRELRLHGQAVELRSGALRAHAQTAEVEVEQARLTARSLSTFVEKLQQVAGVVQIRANRIVERAKDVYREAEGLSQQRAGRLKLLAENTLHLLGTRAFFKAEKDLKIDADKIHLG